MRNPNETRIQLVTSFEVPAVSRFVAEERFKESSVIDGVRFGLFGKNFKALIKDRVEENVPALTLNVSMLTTPWTNQEIVDSFPSICLAHLFECLKLQPNSERWDEETRPLLTAHGSENIFHIEGTDWIVRVEQEGGGWHPGANHASDLKGGGGEVGHQVISPAIGVSRAL